MIHYPTAEIAERWCQRHGMHIRDAGALASALYRPAQVVFGDEVYLGLAMKAAVLLDGISRLHPLLDGNKRLAWAMTSAFLQVNGGYILRVDAAEGDEFVRLVAGEHLDLDKIAAWITEHADLPPGA